MFNFRKGANKLDSDQYKEHCYLFVPVIAHYNEHTLISKDGHLIQTIRVRSVDAKEAGESLLQLRQVVREALLGAIGDSKELAVWVHTIKTMADLSDHAQYSCFFASELNDEWNKKNYWCDKYINNLYISIVHQAAKIDFDNFSSFLKILTGDGLIVAHQRYCQDALNNLNRVSEMLVQGLSEYGAYRLGLIESSDGVHSQLAALYQQLLWFEEGFFYLQDVQLSDLLTYDKRYAIGNDKIEISVGDSSKFAAIVSIKEYQEIPVQELDYLLQIPAGMIVTEVFYAVDRSEIASKFIERNQILQTHADQKLIQASQFIVATQQNNESFCAQRISITVINDTLDTLDINIKKVSQKLSLLGLMHVREDIDLEAGFWSNLPGNFLFLKRLSYNLLRYTGAFASVHNFPLGSKYNKWGRAVTLFRTEIGTPYFFNLHGDNDSNVTAIIGHERSGKTVLTNFITAQAQKYQVSTLYISQTTSSRIFNYMLGSVCYINDLKGLVNPLLWASRDSIKEFFKIILNHYIVPLSDEDLQTLELLLDWIAGLEQAQKTLTFVLQNFDFAGKGAATQKWLEILKPFVADGYCAGMFDCAESVRANNLYFALGGISAEWFTVKFRPLEQKYLEQFYRDLDYHHSVRFALFYALIKTHDECYGSGRKMLVLDSLDILINAHYFMQKAFQVLDEYQKNNGVIIFNANRRSIFIEHKSSIEKMAQVILLSGNYPLEAHELYSITQTDREKLAQFSSIMHGFMLVRNKACIGLELSISNLEAITKILSCKKKDEVLFDKILQNDQSQSAEELQRKVYSVLQAKLV
ncbi:Type IV secretion system protein VirB4 [Rickettsiales endosymbiont of Paramecium tredecaurelia]|uniref:VirB4 family type IV secretion/conjugal transfer ATPase n=1 Tax=Candidatus Sarmatiella mevalonica TaxID=2770581 RepID=UPI0019246282|nr:hypothetical protein [Candidatus Sarmatiella mevalonica]MBL3284301.1 Type IV secretion system protein VirB4 [Candidatus Sarmatiella mevalonica]